MVHSTDLCYSTALSAVLCSVQQVFNIFHRFNICACSSPWLLCRVNSTKGNGVNTEDFVALFYSVESAY